MIRPVFHSFRCFGPILLALLVAGVLEGAEPEAGLRYRRVFVPQADIDQQIRGLLPLSRDEFERRIERAALLAEESTQADQVQISQAAYRARLDGNILVEGRAEWTVALRREAPALLVLGPCNLALGTALWRDSFPRPAQLGIGPDGQLACVVARSGQLEFDWTLAGQEDGRGILTFPLQLPPTPINRLEIELPAGARLTTDHGLAAPKEPASQKNLWLVEAGGTRQLTLQVNRPAAETRTEPLVLVHETTTYLVQRATVDVETALQLDVLQQPLAQLHLLLDEPLQLTQVRIGERILPAVPLPESEGRRQVVVPLPQPILGEGLVVQLSGVAGWTGTGTQRLPRMRLAGGTWQDGRATVTAPAALQLEATPEVGCWQTAFSPSSPVRLEEQWQFQYYLPDAEVQIAAAQIAAPLTEASGIALDFQPSQVQATLTAELAAVTAPRFDVEAQIPRAWIVDAVEVQPAEMLEDRSLQTRGGGPQSLRLALRRPIAVGRPLTVVIRAHRRRPAAGQAISGDFAVLARFATVREARRLVALRSSDPAAQILLSGDEDVPRIDPQTLSASQLRLFEGTPGPLVFELDQRADSLSIRPAPASPRFRADTLVRAQVGKNQLRQTCRLRIAPEESLLEAVTVRFAPPPPEPIQWTVAGESLREVTVRRLEPPGANASEAVYEVKLQRPRRTSFELVAEFASATSPAHLVSLASVPAAAAQTGLAEVHADEGPVAIQAPELLAILPHGRSQPGVTTLRGAYRYDPGRAGSLRVSPLPAGSGLPLGWIESLQLTTRIAADGGGDHEAQLVVHSRGQRQLVLTLAPPGADLRVDIDGEPVSGRLTGARADQYALPLPEARESVRVRLTYSSPPPDADWRPWRRRVSFPLPQPALPVLLSSWQVQLAPGLELNSAGAAPHDNRAADSIWQPQLLASLHHQPYLAAERSSDTLEAAGWTTYVLPYGSQSVGQLQVVVPAVIQLWGWCLALAIAAVSWYFVPSLARLAGMTAILAAASLLLPPEAAPLGAGALVGLLIGAAAGLLRPVPALSYVRAGSGEQRPSTSFAARPTLWLLVILAGVASVANAAPPDPPEGQGAVIRRVVIPVDDDRQPAGDYVFLEPELYDLLLSLTDRDPSGLPDWLVHSATYRASLASEGESTALESVVAEFEAETYTADATIELGFLRKEIHLIEGRARLDGRPLLTQWSAEGRLTLVVPMPGSHRLELAFSPAAALKDGPLCDVQIPALASSRLILSDDGQVEAEGGHGTTSRDASGQLVTQLGSAGRLKLKSRMDSPRPDSVAVVEAEQLVLWKVRPGSVIAEGRFRIRPIGGAVGEAAIDLDPRLRLLPLPATTPVARHWIQQSPGGSSRLHLVLDQPTMGETVVQASFLWTGATGIGNLALPRIAVRSDKLVRDWAGVVLMGGLAWKSKPAAAAQSAPAAALAAAWPDVVPEDVVTLDLAQRSAIELSTEPQRLRVKAIERLDCSVSAKSTALLYTARLANVPPHALQHRLQISPGLNITRLTVLSGDRPVLSQWIQGADQALVIQLTQPPPAQIEILVEGRSAGGRLPATTAVELIQYVGAAEDELLLSIYQQAGVQVAVQPGDAAWGEEDSPDEGRYREGLGRLAATLRRVGGPVSAGPRMSASAANRELSGVVVSRLVSEQADWWLEVECLLNVQSGVLESLRLDLPPTLAGPLEIVPAAEHQLAAAPSGATQRLLIRPQRAVNDTLGLVIRARLQAGVDPTAIPLAVSLVDTPQVRRLVALPRRSGDRRFDWETSGLQAIDVATLKLPANSIPAGYELFEAVADRPTATPQRRSPGSSSARVLLAQHELRIGDGRRVSGKAIFDVVPGGARQFTLAIPPGCRLVHVSVEGIPAQVVGQGAGHWVIEAVNDRATQRMEVVYDGLLSAAAASDAVPRLVGLSPEKSLWSVAGSEVDSVRHGGRLVEGASPEHGVVLLESLATVIDALSIAPARDLPGGEFLESLSAWRQRFLAARAPLDGNLPSPLAARTAAANQKVQQALYRLTESGLSLPPEPAGLEAGSHAAWSWQWLAADPSEKVEVSLAAPAWLSADVRLAFALALLVAGIVAAWSLGHVAAETWLTQHAHFAVAVLGATLMAVGVVPWLGAIVVLLAVWRAVHSVWPRSPGDMSSTILLRRS
jgi:hypothetical protein